MSSRGEKQFIKFPRFATSLYDYLSSTESMKVWYNDIAVFLVSQTSKGKLMDVGTGPGKLLTTINRINPDIELYGLDISESMILQAKKNLFNISVDLRQGNIRKTDYNDNFFDIITSTGSFYLWDHPEDSLEEIYRILKVNHHAYLFDTYQEYDKNEFKEALKSNLKKENLIMRLLSPFFLKQQLKMAYKIPEIQSILEETSFKNNYELDKVTLGGLPIWLRIKLTKT
jgi:ubiquinone/menaquinone biosynthesis C-methylase UbiE